VAPGNGIVSALAPNNKLLLAYPDNAVPASYYRTNTSAASGYMELSGTSMATPVVAGAVALMLQKTPTLTPDAVKAKLMKTATKSFSGPAVWTDPATGRTYKAEHNILTVGAAISTSGPR
jgi:serine protease AprX